MAIGKHTPSPIIDRNAKNVEIYLARISILFYLQSKIAGSFLATNKYLTDNPALLIILEEVAIYN